jgi:hypothetical protein
MDVLKNNRNMIFKVLGFWIFFHSALLADSTLTAHQRSITSNRTQSTQESKGKESQEMTSISLDSFGSTGIVLMLILSSLLGAFFVRDEFGSLS